jgi:methylmalonyl-CoA/ethylmalonyl-CoA epimerase
MLSRVHHVGLVVRRMEDGLRFWRDTLGLRVSKEATVADQGVRAALLPIGRSEIELLEPIDPAGGVAKFLARRGEGLHHVCFQTQDVEADLHRAAARGLPLIDQRPRPGLAGTICFLHPKGTRGVLVEFAQPPSGEHHVQTAGSGPLAGLTLLEVTALSRDAAEAAAHFAHQFGFPRMPAPATPELVASAVEVSGVRLVFVSANAGAVSREAATFRSRLASAGEGLAGLVLGVRDVRAAATALAPLEAAAEADGAFTLPIASSRGVPLRIRKVSAPAGA